MTFTNSSADCFVPDGLDIETALARTTHMGVGAHQDDLEFFAAHGILECFRRSDRWFCGVTATDGAGSARAGLYKGFSDQQMAMVRMQEQRKAAAVGEYGVMIQLDHPSAAVKDHANPGLMEDVAAILAVAQPEVLYLHNPADKHDTHVAVLSQCIAAIRQLPAAERPLRIYGCEIWRDLDWLPDGRKIALPVGGRTNLQAALNGVFDSQIAGGKRYDLAVMGRRLAHATFHESHAIDAETGLVFAMDLSPVCRDDGPNLSEYAAELTDAFAREVQERLEKFAGIRSGT